jgi:hypothetical protein
MRARWFLTPFLVVAFVAVASSANATTASDRRNCATPKLRVPVMAHGSLIGTVVFRPTFCFDGSTITVFHPRTHGMAADGWTYRGAVHVRYFGGLGTPFRSVWESIQFCHGATPKACIGSHESVFPSVWLVAHGSGDYRIGRAVRVVES